MARVECVAFLPLFLIFPHLLPCRAQNASTPSTAVPLPSATPVSVSSAYACQKCVTKSVRAMYLYHADFTECVGARGKGEGCGNGATATPECFNWKNWKSGWIGAAAHRILTELGPPSVIAMTPANFSVESRLFYQGSSDYTRCLYEIRLGKVDLCVGRFWETPEYRRLVPFTSQLFVDNLRLITTPMDFTPSTGYAVIDAVNKFNYATLYRHIIQPFSNEVWYITSGMLIFGGIVIWLVESVAPDSRFARESVLSGICKSVWVSWMSFVCATSAVEVTRWPGRLIMVGYAFFIYVVVVLYVANLSAILSLKSTQKASISSIQDINREGSFLCLIEDMANLIAYTLPQQQMLIFDEYGPALEKLYRGGCAGSLIGFFEYHKYIRAQDVSFSVCLDPLDERGWSKCKNPTSKSAFIDLNCKCKSDPKLDPKDCIFDCPFANKRYCPLLEVMRWVYTFVQMLISARSLLFDVSWCCCTHMCVCVYLCLYCVFVCIACWCRFMNVSAGAGVCPCALDCVPPICLCA
jgi:hypothetical protein